MLIGAKLYLVSEIFSVIFVFYHFGMKFYNSLVNVA